MPRSSKAKPSATGVAKSMKGQMTAMSASQRRRMHNAMMDRKAKARKRATARRAAMKRY